MSIVITLGLFVAYGFASVFGLLIIKRSFHLGQVVSCG